jgi:hypothetical protein
MYDPPSPVPSWTGSTMRRVAGEPKLAAAAIRHANLGIPVFPCVPGGKRPLTPNGFHDATSARVVHQWWQRNPDANIGLATGSSTGVLVVDVDVHSGGSGFEAFERARPEGLAVSWVGWFAPHPAAPRPTTRLSRTRSSAPGRTPRAASDGRTLAARAPLRHREHADLPQAHRPRQRRRSGLRDEGAGLVPSRQRRDPIVYRQESDQHGATSAALRLTGTEQPSSPPSGSAKAPADQAPLVPRATPDASGRTRSFRYVVSHVGKSRP